MVLPVIFSELKINTILYAKKSIGNKRQMNDEMVEKFSILQNYFPCGIFNANETALFWKFRPD